MLILHAGAKAVDREQVDASVTPPSTYTHYPLPHGRFLEIAIEGLNKAGYDVVDEQHGLYESELKQHGKVHSYFGVLQVRRQGAVYHSIYQGDEKPQDDWTAVVGLRNDHYKRFAAGMCLGSQVFVCDNLAFMGDFAVLRKHTRYVERDFVTLAHNAANRLREMNMTLEQRYSQYKQTELTLGQGDMILSRCVKDGALGAPKLIEAMNEWRQPRHPEFSEPTAWSLFNAVTEISKGLRPTTLTAKTETLHRVFDREIQALAV